VPRGARILGQGGSNGEPEHELAGDGPDRGPADHLERLHRIGYAVLTLPQLKILQEVITLAVFVPFAMFYMHQPLKLDYLWAALCMVGAVYFIFRA